MEEILMMEDKTIPSRNSRLAGQRKGADSPSINDGERRPIAILGVPFDNLTMGKAVERIQAMIASQEPHYAVTANVDFLVQAREDVELRHILFESDLVLCDGTPLLWASRVLGNPLRERVAGSDLVPLLIEKAAKKGYRVFFLGATPEASEAAVARMKQKYPELIVAGHYSPPFNKLLEMDHEEITRRIEEGRPDLLFVSFGCPKQEKWIAMHYRSLRVPVCIGVGATIDFLAGQVKRAPRWMQRTGTEWIFRLLQEPRRLFRRYSKDLRVFAWEIFKQWWQMRFSGRVKWSKNVGDTPPALRQLKRSMGRGSELVNIEMFAVPERLDLLAIQERCFRLDEMDLGRKHLLLDLGGVEFIDSSGMGWLVGLKKRIRATQGQLILVNPSAAVQRALSLMRLEEFFARAPDVASALRFLKRASEKPAVTLADGSCGSLVEWHGEITAANADEVWQETVSSLMLENPQEADKGPNALTVDLADVRFIDSSGLGLMIRIKKLANQNAIRLFFDNVQPAVGNVIHLARLETFLFGENEIAAAKA